jgi:integrase
VAGVAHRCARAEVRSWRPAARYNPLGGEQLRALRRLQRETPEVHVFVYERQAPFSVAAYQRMVFRAGLTAGFPFLVHSHMLRHSCGHKLANFLTLSRCSGRGSKSHWNKIRSHLEFKWSAKEATNQPA